MERGDLQRLWQELFGRPPHPKLRRQLLVPILAYRAQEKTYGGLKPSTQEYLRKLALQVEVEKSGKPVLRIKPGTKLIREWRGEFHEVFVTENGYQYRFSSEYVRRMFNLSMLSPKMVEKIKDGSTPTQPSIASFRFQTKIWNEQTS